MTLNTDNKISVFCIQNNINVGLFSFHVKVSFVLNVCC